MSKDKKRVKRLETRLSAVEEDISKFKAGLDDLPCKPLVGLENNLGEFAELATGLRVSNEFAGAVDDALATLKDGACSCAMTTKVSAAGKEAFAEAAAGTGKSVPEAMRAAMAAYIAEYSIAIAAYSVHSMPR